MQGPDADASPQGGALMGLARLMTAAFEGTDLRPIADRLIERARTNPGDAEALMDLACALQLRGIRDVGLQALDEALKIQRLYRLPHPAPIALRMLALMAPGDLMANTPLDFLVAGSDVELSMLYLALDDAAPIDTTAWPAHDLVFIAVSESDPTRDLLSRLALAAPRWQRPVVNLPQRILQTSRALAYRHLADVPGICMPPSMRATREHLQQLIAQRIVLTELLEDGVFPIIVRPVDSHAGHDLAKVEDADELAAYLAKTAGEAFVISRFVDYRSDDGQFRKYRVVLIDGLAYPGHMGISSHWMIHYLNAGMTESAQKRIEEAAWMHRFDRAFGLRHAAALHAISKRFGLDYLVIDCAETPAGELLIFEVDPAAIVHAMDPVDLFPYKRAHMQRVFDAFLAMLRDRAGAIRSAP